jgi:hypothetical protein
VAEEHFAKNCCAFVTPDALADPKLNGDGAQIAALAGRRQGR